MDVEWARQLGEPGQLLAGLWAGLTLEQIAEKRGWDPATTRSMVEAAQRAVADRNGGS